MYIAATVSILLAVSFAALYLLQRTQTKRLTRQLKKLNDEKRTQWVSMSFPSRTNQELVLELNRLLSEKQLTSQ